MKWSEYVGYPYNLYFRLAGLIFFFFFPLGIVKELRDLSFFQFHFVPHITPLKQSFTLMYYNCFVGVE